jgi:hypothetical protein
VEITVRITAYIKAQDVVVHPIEVLIRMPGGRVAIIDLVPANDTFFI